jgi:hypothetical protein
MGHGRLRVNGTGTMQLDRTAIQQDQAMPRGATRHDRLAANYLVDREECFPSAI